MKRRAFNLGWLFVGSARLCRWYWQLCENSPNVAGQNGGGVFVLFYLLFLLIMGVPVLTMELAVGRPAAKRGAGYQLWEPAAANGTGMVGFALPAVIC